LEWPTTLVISPPLQVKPATLYAQHGSDEHMPSQITLNSNAEDIQSLVIRILGRGLISRIIGSGFFTLRHEDIFDLHRRVTQRVTSQNESRLVDFYCKYVFSDNSEELIPSDKDFSSFRYLGTKRPRRVELNYAFLIRFGSRDYEKQQLTVEIDVRDLRRKIGASRRKFQSEVKESTDWFDTGSIALNIEYTDPIWANDIRNLFEQYTNEKLQKSKLISGTYRLLTIWSPYPEMTLSMLGMIYFIGSSFGSSERQALRERLLNVSTGSLGSLSERIDFLVTGSEPDSTRLMLVFSVAFVMPLLLITMLRKAVEVALPQSHIILNERNEMDFRRDQRSVVKKFLIYTGSFLVAVTAGVLATRIDVLLKAFGW